MRGMWPFTAFDSASSTSIISRSSGDEDGEPGGFGSRVMPKPKGSKSDLRSDANNAS